MQHVNIDFTFRFCEKAKQCQPQAETLPPRGTYYGMMQFELECKLAFYLSKMIKQKGLCASWGSAIEQINPVKPHTNANKLNEICGRPSCTMQNQFVSICAWRQKLASATLRCPSPLYPHSTSTQRGHNWTLLTMRVTGSMAKAQYERDAICNIQHTIPMQVPAGGDTGVQRKQQWKRKWWTLSSIALKPNVTWSLEICGWANVSFAYVNRISILHSPLGGGTCPRPANF